MTRVLVQTALCVLLFILLSSFGQPCLARVYAMQVKSTSPGPQSLESRNGKLEMNLPSGYTFAVLPLGVRTTYMFMGPDDRNQKHAVLSVDALPYSEKNKTTKAVLESVFTAYGKGSSDFTSKITAPLTVDGKIFEKGVFSGSIDGDKSSGFALVVRVKKGFWVMVARDRESEFKKSEGIMLGIVKSCKIKGE
jgi:hypothetical protein